MTNIFTSQDTGEQKLEKDLNYLAIFSRESGGTAYASVLEISSTPSLEIDSYGSRNNTNGIPDLCLFNRASSATFTNQLGQIETAAVDQLRHDYDSSGKYLGILIENQRTNFLLNSATPVTQSVSLSAGDYTTSVYGSGDCTLSGGATGVATEGSDVVFNLAAPALVTFTVSGSLDRFQCEDGKYSTSFISTAGVSATRAADNFRVLTSAFPFNSSEGSVLIEYNSSNSGTCACSINDQTYQNRLTLIKNAIGVDSFRLYVASANVFTIDIESLSYAAAAFSYKDSSFYVSANGSDPLSSLVGTVPAFTQFALGQITGGFNCLDGHITRVAYFPKAISPDELKLTSRK